MNRLPLLCVLLGLATFNAEAQAPSYDVHPDYLARRYSVQDGLPSNQVTDLAVQPGGYLWVGTADGLVRFDGHAFTTFDAATSGLESNRIEQIFLDPAGQSADAPVWFRAEGPVLYRFQHGSFEALPPGQGLTAVPPHVAFFARGTPWIVSQDRVWTWSEGALRLRWPGHFRPGEATYAVHRANDGSAWVVQRSAVLHVGAGHVQRFPIPAGWVAADAWNLLSTLDATGAVWLSTPRGVARLRGRQFALVAPMEDAWLLSATADGRVWVAQTGRGTWSRVDSSGVAPSLRPLLESGGLSKRVALGPDGGAWFAHGGWLFRDTTPIARLAASPAATLPLLVEADGTVWVGDTGGLVRVTPRAVTVVSEPEGLGGRNAYPVLATRGGAVWVGLWYEPYQLARIEGGVPVARVPLRGVPAVTALLEGRDGSIWAGTPGFGLFRIENDRPVHVLDVSETCGNLPPININALLEDRRGRMWVGAEGRLLRGERADGGWRWTCADLGDLSVRALVETRRGEILVATLGRGLGRMTARGQVEWLTQADGLASDNVRDVAEDERGVLWIATQDRGLCRLDRGDGASLRAGALGCLSEADGLHDNSLHRVLFDDDGRLWLNSNKGVFALDRAEAAAVALGRAAAVSVRAFTEADGLRSREGNGGRQPAGSRAPDGRLWFPTQDGVVMVDPAQIPRPQGPVARVEAVVVGDRAVPEPAWRAGGLIMGPGERDLQVAFTGIALDTPESVRFRVRLVGRQDEWREVGATRSHAYVNLPPGAYTVEVQATRGGAWGEPARLAVVRQPFLWERWWARVALVLAGLGLVVGAVRWRVRGHEARQRELEATVESRTAQLVRANEVKARFLQNVSHELRTPLALLLGPVRDLRDGRFSVEDRARPLLDRAVSNGERLQRLIDELLLLARLDGDALVVERQRLDLAAFARDRVAAFDSTASAAGVEVGVDAPAGPVWVAVDPAKLETVLYNLVGNALAFTPAGGRVVVGVRPERGGARIDVADTGVGIAEDDLPHLFDRFFQGGTAASRRGGGAGIGLALARELVELHGGTITAQSELGVGTTISVRLPVGDAEGAPAEPAPAPTRPPPLASRHSGGVPAPAPDDDLPLVLVVEDNSDLRSYLGALLEGRYHVATAADGAEGIALAVEIVPDLVVSDVMMPGLDGFALLAALKADVRTSHVPVVLLTARADIESRLAGLGAGADGYLAKPFEAAELEASVANLIENRRRLRAAWSAAQSRRALEPAGAPKVALAPSEAAFLDRVSGAVRDHIRDADFGAAALAETMGLSPRQLRRKLKALTDESPGDYVRRVRLEHAAELLGEGVLSVKEVAWEAGFGSPSGFRTAFRDAYGVAPARYRKA